MLVTEYMEGEAHAFKASLLLYCCQPVYPDWHENTD